MAKKLLNIFTAIQLFFIYKILLKPLKYKCTISPALFCLKNSNLSLNMFHDNFFPEIYHKHGSSMQDSKVDPPGNDKNLV